MLIFGKALKELRAEKELTLKQLEIATGIDDSLLQRWENGQLETICQHLITLSNFYNIPLDEFLGKK